MSQTQPQMPMGAVDPFAAFAMRPPSQAWERVELPPHFCWIWIKPPAVPHGLIFLVPDEVRQAAPQVVAQWSLRQLLHAAGVDPRIVAMWQLNGAPYDAMNGTNPYLDAPLPSPIEGIDPAVTVYLHVAPPVAPPMGVPPMGAPMFAMPPGQMMPPGMMPMHPGMAAMPEMDAAGPAMKVFAGAGAQVPPLPKPLGIPVFGDAMKESFDRMEADWLASIELDRDLVRQRKQLTDLIGRLKNMNRDLNPEERMHANNQDKKDWADARRGLRDGGLRLWRCIKELDMGDTSSAGQREWFQLIYENYVVPRMQFENMTQAQRGYEMYRKSVTTLHGTIGTTYSIAQLEGERKAQQVMQRIQQKIRDATNKKNFLGLIVD
ncbi:MAG: hypothetical protein AB7O26_02190 [Planctomycetaceae bacterium]